MPSDNHRPVLSSTPSLPFIPVDEAVPLDEPDSYLSLAGFLAEDHARSRTFTTTTSSTGPSTVLSPKTETSTHYNIDKILARCSIAASKRAFNRQLHETDLEWRTRRTHSPNTRGAMVEVSGDLRETHDALMRCLYDPGELGDQIEEVREEEGKDNAYRWRPSEEQLGRVSWRIEDGEGQMESPTNGVRSGSEVSEATIVHMRGGGMQEFFGLKRPSDAKSLPQRPEIISRPSDAFDQTERPNGAATIPGPRCFEGPQATLVRPRDSQLLRVQRMEKLAPPSLFSSDGLSETADSGKTASIVPEGSIASFYVGSQTRRGTLHASSDSRDSRVSVNNFPSPPPSSTGGHNEPYPRKLSTTGSDRSESTVRYSSSTVEIPTTNLQEQWNSGSPSFKPLRGGVRGIYADEDSTNERRGEETSTVRKLGSPLQSPIRDIRDRIFADDWSADSWNRYPQELGKPQAWSVASDSPGNPEVESPSSPSHQSGSQPPPSGYIQVPQTELVVTPTRGDLRKSIEGSLRKHRRPIEQSQVANPPLRVTDGQNGRPYLFPPGSALSSDIALPPDTRAPSNRSVWQGGSHLSIAPEDSASEAGARAQLRAQTGSKPHRGREAKLFPGEALTEVGESHETEEEAKEKSEERFREEIRIAWGNYQTRMRMINEDVGKPPEEKEWAAREEHRILELLISQASTDTGFEQLHEPWQKDEFVRNMFGVRAKTSTTPSILRKANKVMKWFLAVPDDPKLKTWSSRRRGLQYSKLDAAPSSLQRRATNATSSQPSRSTTLNARNRYHRQEEGGILLSPKQHRQLHFAPNPLVNAQALRQPSFATLGYSSQATSAQGKAEKVDNGPSVASSETGWPTQSQAGGGR
ncbi:uncharacterized protein N0V89_002492 [Didymosphaeria variabile]|uniref:Uncharacterized protein n=1 Tax=Didymosphaeria variabile TaxID=1932322 RepID=A0A9W8XUF4_9PLEO|nr:uncharacterized protein N0V89_002492 [Didymosphaeria variabile]KAJ4357915.1 hypothetical protein N0V89_002492 [Didymosphaeria variabile]